MPAGQLSCVQWPAVTTVARTPFRVPSTFRSCSRSLVFFLVTLFVNFLFPSSRGVARIWMRVVLHGIPI